MLKAVWLYRHFIAASMRGELERRIARSRLGALWFFLNPLIQAAIFAFVLAEVIAGKLPNVAGTSAYALHVAAGMAAWSLFSEIATRSTTIFIEYGAALKRISFPRLCLPLIVWGSALINHGLLLMATAAVFMFLGHMPGLAWGGIGVALLLITGFAFGLGILLGVFNVFARDVGQVFGVVIQIWFWATPIVYVPELLPERFRWLVHLNPLTPLVTVYQRAMVENTLPPWELLMAPTVFVASLLALALFVFRRAGAELVDAL